MLVLSGLAAAAYAAPTTFIEGNVRVQFLSPTLVRLELKGPKGFEDRPTFTVVERDWPGCKMTTKTAPGMTILSTPNLVVYIPSGDTLEGIVVADSKLKALFHYDGAKPPAASFFPAPSSKPTSYVVSDSPRLIPSLWGATPAPASNTSFQETSGWDTGNDAPDVYVFANTDYKKMRSEFLRLTGPTELPPLFAFGFIDSRWYRYSEQTALASIDEYRKRHIPLDMFVCDTDWRVNGSDGYQIATNYFPDMPRFIQEAHDRHVRLMFNDHPSPVTKALDPKELETRWNGLTSLLNMGMDVWWYDRNWSTHLREPMPGIRPEVWGQALYHDITQRARPDQRPLIMTNVQGIDNGFWNYAPHPASHRYPMQWTGDTGGTWAFLNRCVENGVRSGVERLHAYVNDDLGGHTSPPTPELYVRYLEYGCLGPITRVHCTLGQSRMPWTFGPEAERIVPEYIKLRYRLLPTIYSAAHRNYEDGTPILQRCDLQWPTYKEAADDTQFLLGDDILVAPILQPMTPIAKAIPAGLLDGGLKAEYFDNKNLEGDPKVVRTDPNVDFDWGDGSPMPDFPKDRFSIRWTGKLGPIAETASYNLQLNVDDGARLWIDGKLIIDSWKPNDNGIYETRLRFAKGSTHDVKLEYYEETGQAKIRLGWQKVVAPVSESKRTVWIPPGEWQDLWTGTRVVGPKKIVATASLEQMPMWFRCGGMIFTGPDMQYTGQKPLDPVTVNVILPTGDGTWTRTLYQDDGLSNSYKSNQFAKTQVKLVKKGKKITLTVLPSTGAKAGLAPGSYRIRVFGAADGIHEVAFSSPRQRLKSFPADGKLGLRFGNVKVPAYETVLRRLNTRSPLSAEIAVKLWRIGKL